MDEIVFALRAPAGKLAFAYIKPMLLYAALPLALLITTSVYVGRHLSLSGFTTFTLFLCLGAFFFARYEVHSLHLEEFIASQRQENHTKFIEEHYVAPSTHDLLFPAKKRNLIHIYLESMETTFADKASGGGFLKNVIPELTELALEGETFSGNSHQMNGALSLNGATWTMGGAFAAETGLPLKIAIEGNAMSTQDHFFKSVVGLGDILHSAGYKTMVMKDVDMTFAGAEMFYREHGNHEVIDYKYAANHGLIPRGYFVWTGFEDSRLFPIAKDKLIELAQSGKPFAFTFFTNDTHFPAGYVCDICPRDFPDTYSNVFHCASKQVTQFIRWVQSQPFYENTTIVVHGDHPTVSASYTDKISADYERRVFTTFLNAPLSPNLRTERHYSTFDLFPTMLAALGVSIPGDRLGLGVNLFSSEPTLVEKLGKFQLNHELSQGSSFMERLGKIDKYAGKTDLSQFCIRDFDCFLDSVIEAKKKNTLIILAINDEGTASLTQGNLARLKKLGITSDLRGHFRDAFVAMMTDKTLFEEIKKGVIEKTFSIGNHHLQVRSAGYDYGQSSIVIDGVERAKNCRGFNVVVYDLENQRLLASEAFDTYDSGKRWR